VRRSRINKIALRTGLRDDREIVGLDAYMASHVTNNTIGFLVW
jgi:hypothetical protein